MNRHAVFHRPESNLAYASAGDILTVILRASAKDRFDRVEILYNNKYDFTKTRNAGDMKRCASDGEFCYYRADLKLDDPRLAYIFRITERGETYYFSEEGLSETYDFALAYYTFFQFAYINTADVPKVIGWTENAVFYQIFVDRFFRANYEKDESYINVEWGGDIDRYSFAGGDLDGVARKIPYLRGLGVNALYLTPIFSADTNHKYNVRDYLHVDPQFGGDGALKRMLETAHGAGMKVIIDAVFNHCDCKHEYFQDVVKRGRASRYHEWFIIDGDFPDPEKGNFARFADCRYMPKWNTSNPEVRRYLIDIALGYLKAGFDGLRLDVADEISHAMWRELRCEVKKAYPEALVLGEIWHVAEPWLRGDQFDGIMNYKLQKILADYFGANPVSAQSASDRMNRLLYANPAQFNAMALNFLDNHDTPRFLRFAGGNRDKLLCALCADVMFPGMPCVFYGTELPLDGAGDPDCRKIFDWTFSAQSPEYLRSFKAVLALKSEIALAGAEAEITAENGMLKIVRTHGGESVSAYFNTGKKPKKLCADNVIFSLNYKNNTLSGNGAVVVKNK